MIQINHFKNVIQLLDYFKDEETCKQYLEQSRWGGKMCCPSCDNEKVYRTNRGFRCADRKCGRKFSVTVGSVMENTKIKLRFWFAAIYLISAHKKGISSHQLARDLGVCQKTSWFMLHRIREMMREKEPVRLGANSPVECDEVAIGGLEKNKHKSTRAKRGIATYERADTKATVFGMLERGGKVITMKVPDRKSHTLQPIILKNVEPGSNVMTDEHYAYRGLRCNFTHAVVKHSAHQYVDGGVHTQGIENYWSLLTRSIIGIYHHVTPKHLNRYCDEMSYRFNYRKYTDCQRFAKTLTQANGRLRWQDLVDNASC